MWPVLLSALALTMVLEGVLPFASPRHWRKAFEQAARLSDGQLRLFGLASMLGGLLLLGAMAR